MAKMAVSGCTCLANVFTLSTVLLSLVICCETAPSALDWKTVGCKQTTYQSEGGRLSSKLQCDGLELQEIPKLNTLRRERITRLDCIDNSMTRLDVHSFNEVVGSTLADSMLFVVLSKNKITSIEHGSLDAFQALTSLDLAFNHLTVVSEMFVVGLPALTALNVSHNNIGAVLTETPTLSKLSLLTSLAMEGNLAVCVILSTTPPTLNCKCSLSDLTNSTHCPITDEHTLRNPCKVDKAKLGSVIADCRGADLQAFPSVYLPLDVTEAHLSGNRIQHIDTAAVNRFEALRRLFIDNNAITSISPGALDSLTVLEMQRNPSTCTLDPSFLQPLCVCANSFVGDGSFCVRQIDLTATPICTIESNRAHQDDGRFTVGVDCSAKDLFTVPRGLPPTTTILSLDNNKISHLDGDDFVSLTMLTTLSLKNNMIATITLDWQKLVGLHVLTMFGNPSVCSTKDLGALANPSTNPLKPSTNPSSTTTSSSSSIDCRCHSGYGWKPTGCERLAYLWRICSIVSETEDHDISPSTLPSLSSRSSSSSSSASASASSSSTSSSSSSSSLSSATHVTMGLSSTVNLLTIDCSNLKLRRIPAGSNKSMQVLMLAHNEIESVRQDDVLGMENLNELHLQNNLISHIVAGTFMHLKRLKILDLSSNHINVLNAHDFVGVLDNNHLTRLDFRGNPSTCDVKYSLEPSFFNCECGRQHDGNGTYCHAQPNALTECKIETLDAGVSVDCSYRGFTLVPHSVPVDVVDLSLQGNTIQRLPPAFFESLSKLEVLSLSENPIEDIKPFTFLHQQQLVMLEIQTPVDTTSLEFTSFTELSDETQVVLSDMQIVQQEGEMEGPSCSRDLSRRATAGIFDMINTLQTSPNVSSIDMRTTMKCPLNFYLHRFRVHEKRKFVYSGCGICGKKFMSETFLDIHFENRHAAEEPLHATVCPSMLCDVVGCDCQAQCDDDYLQKVRNHCVEVGRACFVNDLFREDFNTVICSNLDCDTIKTQCPEPPPEPYSVTFILFTTIGTLVLLVMFVVLCDRKCNGEYD